MQQPGMRWQIYTKLVPIDGGVAFRWYWRDPEGRESTSSFVSRIACERDASARGYMNTGENEQAMAGYWMDASEP